jgi:hypothetical protein
MRGLDLTGRIKKISSGNSWVGQAGRPQQVTICPERERCRKISARIFDLATQSEMRARRRVGDIAQVNNALRRKRRKWFAGCPRGASGHG